MKHLSDEELRFGIERCKARLSGIMPMGYMNEKRVREALNEYTNELQKRGQNELEFK